MYQFIVLFIGSLLLGLPYSHTQQPARVNEQPAKLMASDTKTLYGIASFYADKFVGRQTANGEIYSHEKLTAACNKLPLNTWIRVTNLRNKKSVIVKVNDRMHPKNMRLVDMSRGAAKKLGYIGRGLTQVKVEVLTKKSTNRRQ